MIGDWGHSILSFGAEKSQVDVSLIPSDKFCLDYEAHILPCSQTHVVQFKETAFDGSEI